METDTWVGTHTLVHHEKSSRASRLIRLIDDDEGGGFFDGVGELFEAGGGGGFGGELGAQAGDGVGEVEQEAASHGEADIADGAAGGGDAALGGDGAGVHADDVAPLIKEAAAGAAVLAGQIGLKIAAAVLEGAQAGDAALGKLGLAAGQGGQREADGGDGAAAGAEVAAGADGKAGVAAAGGKGDLEDGDVVYLAAGQDGGGELVAIIKPHADADAAAHDMPAGAHVTGGTDEKAGAQGEEMAAGLCGAGGWSGFLRGKRIWPLRQRRGA